MLKRLSYAICFFSPAAIAAASQQQYCRVNPVKEIDFCFTLASFQNVSTNAHDVYIRASSRFSNRMGWVAFGTGEIMDSAMMFVFYPGEADDGTYPPCGGVRLLLSGVRYRRQSPHDFVSSTPGPAEALSLTDAVRTHLQHLRGADLIIEFSKFRTEKTIST